MTAIAFIFAPGGSKALPGKNIRLFGGKPLIAWSIQHAQAVKRISRVIVSTDSQEIAAVAQQYGAEAPFIRPAELAQDDSPEWLAWQHALNYLRETTDMLPEVMVSVPATAPLRLPLDVENCLDEYEGGGADVVITVTDARRSPYFTMVTIKADKTVHLVSPPQLPLISRQQVPVVYDMTTVCYAASTEFVMTHNSIFEGRAKAVHVPPARGLDICTLQGIRLQNVIQQRSHLP